MSHLPSPSYPPPAAPSDDRGHETPLWLIFGGIVLILVGLAAVSLVVVNELKPKAGPTYPKTWDSRVAPYARIAAKKRGLTFMHPVAVKFLPAKAFEKTVTTDEKKLKADDRKELDQAAGLLRALGLLRGDVDLFKANNDLNSSGILAYYSLEDKTITVRGERVTPAVAATLVHELTHVLQDQHFAIGNRTKELEKKAEKSGDSAEGSVLDAIIEGDASRMETAYRASLPARKRKALAASEKSDLTQATRRMKKSKVPEVLITLQSAPYTLGETLVQAAAADGGNSTVDTLFRDAPSEETALLDPLKGLKDRRKPVKVATPKLEKGEKKLDSGTFDVLTWYLMLAERVPLKQSLAAADGWGGDRYVSFTRKNRSCARISYAGRTSQDTTRMLLALQGWVADAPGSPAKVNLVGGLVRFESCDPGKGSRIGKDASGDALGLAASRAYIGVQFLKQGASDKVARCMSGRLVTSFTLPQLNDQKYAARPDVQARVQRLLAGCRT